MTHGDSTSVKCPACKRPHAPPMHNRSLRFGEIVEDVARCPHCGCEVRYWARLTVTVEAERESKVK